MMRLIRKIGIFGSGILLVGLSGYTFAAGTNAGTTISNTATLSFQIGGVNQPTVGSSEVGNSTPGAGTPTTFLVDRNLDVTVTTTDTVAVPVAPGGNPFATSDNTNSVALEFTVENTGNARQDIALQAVNAAAAPAAFGVVADAFDPTAATFTYYLEDGTTPGLDALDTVLTPVDVGSGGINVPALTDMEPDGVDIRTVYVVAEIPANGSPGIAADAVAAISLVAAVAEPTTDDPIIATNLGTPGDLILTDDTGTADDASTIDDVFADGAATEAGVDGSFDFAAGAANTDDGDDTAGNGQASSTSAYIIVTAALSVSKTVATVCDNASLATDPKAVPGSIQRYTITVTNGAASGSSATLTKLDDLIPTNTALTVMRDYDGATPGGAAPVCADYAELSGATDMFRAGCTDASGATGTRTICADAASGAYTYYAQGGGVGIDSDGTAAGDTITVCYDNQLDGAADGLDCDGLAATDVVLVADGPAGFAVGELAPDEAVIIEFDVIVQ